MNITFIFPPCVELSIDVIQSLFWLILHFTYLQLYRHAFYDGADINRLVQRMWSE